MLFKNKLVILPVILMAACKIQAAVPVIKEDVKNRTKSQQHSQQNDYRRKGRTNDGDSG